MRTSARLRPSLPIAFAAMLVSTLPSNPVAAEVATEPAVDQRDFSAEAAARHADRFEALRDPELRRHYLDQQESQQWQNLAPRSSIRGRGEADHGGGNPLDLPPEIRQLQKTLGGSQVDQFPSLRPGGFGAPSPSRNDRSPRSSQREAIRALRDAATQLDATANRLEQLDLYRQADGLRHQAQQLRIDARGFGGDPQTTPTPSAPTPTSWEQWPTPSAPSIAPQPVLLPDATPQPSLNSIPTPTPAADPSIPSDPPKPQPLNDSPASSPIAEPVLED